MPASIVRLKGKWYVLITTFDIHHRGEAEETVAAKLENKHYPARVFPFDSWSDAVTRGNALTDEFLDDWSMRDYMQLPVPSELAKARVKVRHRLSEGKEAQPQWKEKLKGLNVKPSVKVSVKKRRTIQK